LFRRKRSGPKGLERPGVDPVGPVAEE